MHSLRHAAHLTGGGGKAAGGGGESAGGGDGKFAGGGGELPCTSRSAQWLHNSCAAALRHGPKHASSLDRWQWRAGWRWACWQAAQHDQSEAVIQK